MDELFSKGGGDHLSLFLAFGKFIVSNFFSQRVFSLFGFKINVSYKST